MKKHGGVPYLPNLVPAKLSRYEFRGTSTNHENNPDILSVDIDRLKNQF